LTGLAEQKSHFGLGGVLTKFGLGGGLTMCGPIIQAPFGSNAGRTVIPGLKMRCQVESLEVV